MEDMKNEYAKEREMLKTAIDEGSCEDIRTPAQVEELQQELFQLEHFGPTLKRLFDAISITNSARNKSFSANEKIVTTPPNKENRKKNEEGKDDTGMRAVLGRLYRKVKVQLWK